MRPQNDAGCEKEKDGDRQKEKQVSAVDDAALEPFIVGHHAEAGQRIDKRGGRPADHNIRDRWPSTENQEETDHDREDKTYYLVPCQRGRQTSDREECTGQQETAA